MHRPGIARVEGDRVILDGTRVEEIERYHRDTLVVVVKRVNEIVAERQAAQRQRAEESARKKEEHEREVRERTQRHPGLEPRSVVAAKAVDVRPGTFGNPAQKLSGGDSSP
jgi:hypothetical protein